MKIGIHQMELPKDFLVYLDSMIKLFHVSQMTRSRNVEPTFSLQRRNGFKIDIWEKSEINSNLLI